jgi:hypothetical protein
MDAGETMVEVIRPTTSSGDTHEGIKQYYIQKIEELQVREMKNDGKMMVRFFFVVKCRGKKSKSTSTSSETK